MDSATGLQRLDSCAQRAAGMPMTPKPAGAAVVAATMLMHQQSWMLTTAGCSARGLVCILHQGTPAHALRFACKFKDGGHPKSIMYP